MKVRVYGFEWQMGSGIPITEFCSYLKILPGPPETNKIITFCDLGDYMGGLLISIKNMKAYCQMKVDGGSFTVSPQKLEDNESIADFNYFIIHKETHKGLYQHYHHSLATTSFCNFCRSNYNKLRSSTIYKEIEEAGGKDSLTKRQKKEIYDKYKGTFSYSILLKPDNFTQYVKQMKNIKDFSVEFSSISDQEKAFLPASELSKRVSHKFIFSEESIVDTIKEKILETLDISDTKKANVTGSDIYGEKVSYKMFKDYASFDEFDYNDIIDNVAIDSDNLESSLRGSEIINMLAKIASESPVRQLLNKKTK